MSAALREYLLRLGKAIEDADKVMKEAQDHLNKRNFKPNGTKEELKRFRDKMNSNRWFLMKRTELQTATHTIEQARDNLDFMIKLIATGAEFDPTAQITDPEGRKFWKKNFGKVRTKPSTASNCRRTARTRSVAVPWAG